MRVRPFVLLELVENALLGIFLKLKFANFQNKLLHFTKYLRFYEDAKGSAPISTGTGGSS